MANGFTFKKPLPNTATQLTSVARNLAYGITIKAADANSGKVYFGYANTVTAGTADATDGFELSAGQAYWIPKYSANDVTEIYLISTNGSEIIYVEGC